MSFKESAETTQVFFGLARDILIILALVLLWFWPGEVAHALLSKGFTNIGGVDLGRLAEGDKSAGRDVGSAAIDADALLNALGKNDINAAKKLAPDLVATLNAAGNTIAGNLATQQRVTQPANAAPSIPAGWLYIGAVDEQKTAWAAGSPKKIAPIPPAQLRAGEELTLSGNVLLHEDPPDLYTASPAKQFANAPVAAALNQGRRVKIVDGPEYSHALAGGFFVWIKVQPV